MLATLCWVLIYIARALEWTKLRYNTFWIDGAASRWTMRKLASSKYNVRIVTPLGRAVLAPCAWMFQAAVALTRLANRGLPPIPPSEGFLVRLYRRATDLRAAK
jgi:hypothetical protein